MTVAELMAALSALPADLPVMVSPNAAASEASDIRKVSWPKARDPRYRTVAVIG